MRAIRPAVCYERANGNFSDEAGTAYSLTRRSGRGPHAAEDLRHATCSNHVAYEFEAGKCGRGARVDHISSSCDANGEARERGGLMGDRVVSGERAGVWSV